METVLIEGLPLDWFEAHAFLRFTHDDRDRCPTDADRFRFDIDRTANPR